MQILLFILAVLVSLSAAAAQPDFYVSVEPVTDNIYFNESAEFIFTITNNRNFDSEFTFKTPQLVHWDVFASPLYDYPSVTVAANGTRDVTLLFHPISSSLGTGTKILSVDVVSDKGVKVPQTITIFIIPEGTEFGQYHPRVVIEGMEISQEINPQEELVLWFRLVNKNSLNLTNVTLEVSSRIITKTAVSLPIGPYAEEMVKIVPVLNKSAEAGNDTINMNIIVKGDIIKGYQRTAQIIEVNLPYEFEENVTKSFLRTEFLYKVINPSNIQKTQTFSMPTSYIDRIFSWTSPKAYISKENGQSYAWDLTLSAGETAEIRVTRSYRSLLYIAIALIVFLIVYYVFKPDLVIDKKLAKEVSKEGGISESTIQMHVKNISKYRIEKVDITEIIPNIAEYVPDEAVGVVPPASVRKYELRGTKLQWHFDELAPQEERILTYKMRTKLDVVGRFRLETTVAEYLKKGKRKTGFSNSVFLSKK
jgi:hypothetical protein